METWDPPEFILLIVIIIIIDISTCILIHVHVLHKPVYGLGEAGGDNGIARPGWGQKPQGRNLSPGGPLPGTGETERAGGSGA